jgi:hypothetical protein
MRLRKVTGALALTIIGTVAAGAQGAAVNYIYTRGPNYVNMSGARCRIGSTVSTQTDLWHGTGQTGVTTSSTRYFYCPVQRRGTAYYEDSSSADAKFLNVSMPALSAEVWDYNSSYGLNCVPFARTTAGSLTYGTTRYLCSTAGGCSSAPAASWQGSGKLSWTNPLPLPTSTVNWGLLCNAASSSGIGAYEASINAN